MHIGILCVVAALIALAIYHLVPLPLLSYQQGGNRLEHGEVTEVKKIRSRVFEISLRQETEIDPRLQQGSVIMTSASLTSFVHFRQCRDLPKVGDRVAVISINRYHFFTGRSFNWMKGWGIMEGDVPKGGRVELVGA